MSEKPTLIMSDGLRGYAVTLFLVALGIILGLYLGSMLPGEWFAQIAKDMSMEAVDIPSFVQDMRALSGFGMGLALAALLWMSAYLLDKLLSNLLYRWLNKSA